MDIDFQMHGTLFVWDMEKAQGNVARHEIAFTEAATVFDDPLLLLTDAARNGESRHKAIGFSHRGKLLAVVHTEPAGELIRIISAWRATAAEADLYDERT